MPTTPRCVATKLFHRSFLSLVSAVLTFVVLTVASTTAFAQAGSLDATFADQGIFTDNFSGPTSFATTVALQSNGQILVGGQISNNGSVIRLNTNGSLDTTFGKGGIVTLKFADIEGVVTGLAIQTNGQILVLGNGIPQGGDIYRLNTNGSVDTSFGSDGPVFLANTTGLLTLRPNGNFLVTSAPVGTTNVVVQQYDSNGKLDTTFGTGGSAPIVGTTAIALLPNGHLLLSALGLTQGSGSLSEYDGDGTLDASFGISGQVPTLDGSAIALQSNGAIVTAGAVTSQLSVTGNSQGFGVTRFNPNGTVDMTFGTHGGVMTTFPNSPTTAATSVVIQPNGDIVVGGEAGTSGIFGSGLVESFALTRYLSTGAIDTSFGTNGLVTTSFSNPAQATIFALALQSDGKIIAVGANGDPGPGGNSVMIVARYLGE